MITVYLCVCSLLCGVGVHYLSHRIPWALEREWLEESVDYLDLDDKDELYSERLAYPEKLPGVFQLWPMKDRQSVLDGPYTPWWLSALFFILFGCFYYQFGPGIAFACSGLFILVSVLASRIDYCHQILPDKLNHFLLWSGLAVNTMAIFTPLSSAVWAVILGYCLIASMTFVFSKFFNRTMLGGGDVKFIAAIGAWVGVKGLLPVILISSLLFVVIMLLGGWLSDNWPRMNAFGPYLTIGGLITLWLGPASLFASLQTWLSVS